MQEWSNFEISLGSRCLTPIFGPDVFDPEPHTAVRCLSHERTTYLCILILPVA